MGFLCRPGTVSIRLSSASHHDSSGPSVLLFLICQAGKATNGAGAGSNMCRRYSAPPQTEAPAAHRGQVRYVPHLNERRSPSHCSEPVCPPHVTVAAAPQGPAHPCPVLSRRQMPLWFHSAWTCTTGARNSPTPARLSSKCPSIHSDRKAGLVEYLNLQLFANRKQCRSDLGQR